MVAVEEARCLSCMTYQTFDFGQHLFLDHGQLAPLDLFNFPLLIELLHIETAFNRFDCHLPKCSRVKSIKFNGNLAEALNIGPVTCVCEFYSIRVMCYVGRGQVYTFDKPR